VNLCVLYVLRGKKLTSLLLFPWAPLVNDKPVKEITQQLITAGFIVGMIFLTEKGAQLAFGNVKIGELEDMDDILVLQFEGYADLFEDIVVGEHGREFNAKVGRKCGSRSAQRKAVSQFA
jgi:hypothetical protein